MAKINANKGRGTMIIKEKTKDRKDVEKVLYFGLWEFLERKVMLAIAYILLRRGGSKEE